MTVRVLQISRSVIDGGFDYHSEISQAFSDGDFEVTTVFLRGSLTPERTAAYCGSVHCFDARRKRIYKNSFAALLRLLVLARGRAFDLVICHHHTPAVIVNTMRRFLDFKKMFCLVHDFDYYNPSDPHGQRRNHFVEHRLDKRCRFIAVSEAIRRNVLESMPFLADERCLVIHNAIDTVALDGAALSRTAARQALGIDAEQFVFGTVGRLVPFKAHRELIEAFALVAEKMPNSRLVIVGRGDLQQALQARVVELGLEEQVRLTGFLPDASRFMSAFDVFVLPSHNEPFGLVLLEAMANSIPVIANNTGAVPEILPYREGIASISDTTGFADTLVSFYQMPTEHRVGLVEQGRRQVAEHFNLSLYRQSYRQLWDR